MMDSGKHVENRSSAAPDHVLETGEVCYTFLLYVGFRSRVSTLSEDSLLQQVVSAAVMSI